MAETTEKSGIHSVYGLIGYRISYSFSEKYFTEKFEKEKIHGHEYKLFQLEDIDHFKSLIESQPLLKGLNVTIPYKQSVMQFLDELDEEAEQVGAVNVIKFTRSKLKGYNSDIYGFEKSLKDFLEKTIGLKALVLGTGGASKAISFVLGKMGIPFQFVSRTQKEGCLTYTELNEDLIASARLIINCTPVGTYPEVDECPPLPYQFVSKGHFFYDLVYNPSETLFLKKAKEQGALTCNGLSMLHLQAEKAWEIWNEQT